jgi:hypothetical protein
MAGLSGGRHTIMSTTNKSWREVTNPRHDIATVLACADWRYGETEVYQARGQCKADRTRDSRERRASLFGLVGAAW